MATETTETLSGKWSSFQDPGAKLLTTLMFSPKDDSIATAIIDYLTPDDFHSPVIGKIFSITKHCRDHNMEFDAATINHIIISDQSNTFGNREVLRTELLTITGLPTVSAQAPALAKEVLNDSYRRQFTRMAESLEFAATEAPTEDLFKIMLEHGSKQRTAANRLNNFDNVISHARQKASPQTQHSNNQLTQSGISQTKHADTQVVANGLVEAMGFSPTTVDFEQVPGSLPPNNTTNPSPYFTKEPTELAY